VESSGSKASFTAPGSLHQVVFHCAPERPRAHRRAGELLALRELRRGRNRGPLVSSAFSIYSESLGRLEVQTEGAALVAFLMEPDRRFVAVLVEVGYL
jgi:hypothetical protein